MPLLSAPWGADRRLLPARVPSLLCHLVGALARVPAPCLCSERFPTQLSCCWPGTGTFNKIFYRTENCDIKVPYQQEEMCSSGGSLSCARLDNREGLRG